MQKHTSSEEKAALAILERLQKEEPRPIYVLYGQEAYFIDKALAILKQKVVPSVDLEPLLYHSLTGSEVDPATLHDLASTPPFVGERQLIVVRRAGEIREPEDGLLVRYAADPAPFTCMVLETGPSMPKGAMFRTVQERDPDGCVEFPRLRGHGLLKWVCRIGREKGIQEPISLSLAEQIVAAAGPDLSSIEREMEKLALCLRDPASGTASELAGAIVSSSAQDESYHLVDHLLRGDWSAGLWVLHRLLAQGLPPLVLLSRISWALRRLWQVKEGIERGESMDRLSSRLRLPFPAKETYRGAALRISWKSLGNLFFCLEETDRALKSSRLPAQVHLEDLCGIVAHELGPAGRKNLGPRRSIRGACG